MELYMAQPETEPKGIRPIGGRGGWKLEDAKARFSEVVRRAQSEGPQRVSVRGRDAVVVMSVEELERIAPAKPRPALLSFLEGLRLDGLNLARDVDQGRDVEL
jgi:antitoxin Phd